MGRGRVISAKDMSNTPGTFPVYSSSALDNGRMGAYGKYMFNQELITWSIDGGGAVFYRRKHRFSVTNVSGYIAVNPEKINCKFLAYAMSLAHSRIKFDYTVKAHPSVIRSLYTMGIPTSLQEQQVIGSFFSRLDNLITLHQRKYDKLCVLKKSMLDKMFPKGGSLYPEIRFAGFTDPWEQRKLGELASKRIEKNTNGIKETFTNSAEHGVVSQLDYFDHDITNDANIGNYSVVHPDDFIYNPRISAVAPCGPINRNKLDRNGVMSPLYTVFSVDDTIDKLYLEHYFKTSRWHQFMFLEGNSGARSDRFSISDSIFFEMPIQCPVLEEQELIASFFGRLDSLITLHQRKLELLRNIKKSMLDKMFV